jgi:hypothetical protein
MVHWNTGISVTNGSRHGDTLEEVERWLTNLLDAYRAIDPDVDVTARAPGRMLLETIARRTASTPLTPAKGT